MQLIGSNDPDKRWLLKNPGHIEKLDLLFAIYPDAKVIQTHRDPAKAIPSLCSLLMNLHPITEEGRNEQRAHNMLAREVAKVGEGGAQGRRGARAKHPGQVLDVIHADFHRDPMAVLERIYAFIGMEIDDELRARFAQRIAREARAAARRAPLRHRRLRHDRQTRSASRSATTFDRYDLVEARSHEGSDLPRPGGQAIVIEELPDPQPGPDDVIIKVGRCGICGTDLSMTRGRMWDFGTNSSSATNTPARSSRSAAT